MFSKAKKTSAIKCLFDVNNCAKNFNFLVGKCHFFLLLIKLSLRFKHQNAKLHQKGTQFLWEKAGQGQLYPTFSSLKSPLFNIDNIVENLIILSKI